jgi:hypothetical protein
MARHEFVVEFRNGSLFRGPRADCGGTLGEAMRFQQAKHARQYLDRKANWAWFNGAMIIPIDRAFTAIANAKRTKGGG